MIINIRGTSGSGKSYLVRRLMKRYQGKIPWHKTDDIEYPAMAGGLKRYVKDRKNPLGYTLYNGLRDGEAVLLGHYETECGGCDTLPNTDFIWHLARRAHDSGRHVIMEGLLLSEEVNRAVNAHGAGYPVHVIWLDTDVEQCIADIKARRFAAFNLKPFNEKNTRNRIKVISRACARLSKAGVPVSRMDRDDAFLCAAALLGVGS